MENFTFFELMHRPMDEPKPSIICSLENYALNPDPVRVALILLDPSKYVVDITRVYFLSPMSVLVNPVSCFLLCS